MSEVLRAPWLLQSVLEDLSNEFGPETGLNHLHRTPKLVQIIQVNLVNVYIYMKFYVIYYIIL